MFILVSVTVMTTPKQVKDSGEPESPKVLGVKRKLSFTDCREKKPNAPEGPLPPLEDIECYESMPESSDEDEDRYHLFWRLVRLIKNPQKRDLKAEDAKLFVNADVTMWRKLAKFFDNENCVLIMVERHVYTNLLKLPKKTLCRRCINRNTTYQMEGETWWKVLTVRNVEIELFQQMCDDKAMICNNCMNMCFIFSFDGEITRNE